MDGTFSHGLGAQKQRILNWTGIFDEIHDFELTTRAVSGGVGAVTEGDCSKLSGETSRNLNPANMGGAEDKNEQLVAGNVGPNQIVCVLRPVGTFGALDPANTTLEVKQDKAGAVGGVAQGNVAGFNVPSLYGLSAGAPLHHG